MFLLTLEAYWGSCLVNQSCVLWRYHFFVHWSGTTHIPSVRPLLYQHSPQSAVCGSTTVWRNPMVLVRNQTLLEVMLYVSLVKSRAYIQTQDWLVPRSSPTLKLLQLRLCRICWRHQQIPGPDKEKGWYLMRLSWSLSSESLFHSP